MTTADLDRIVRVRTTTIQHTLEVPITFGSWVMRHRELALVRIDAESGLRGFAYCLTRDGPIAEIVQRTIAPVYVGAAVRTPGDTFHAALWTNNAVHAAGIGMRALSLVDLAAWDLAARAAGQSISAYLGGGRPRMLVTGIVGYPPSISPAATVDQIAGLWAAGWRRFKLPIAPTRDASIDRLRAAREAFPDAWLGIDANFLHKTAVDVNRVDATTNGGITRLRGIAETVRAAGNLLSPHMYPHIHSQVLGALGHVDSPIEWGIPGTGVHPMDDSLAQPVVRDGRMEPLPEQPGLGTLVDPAWIARQTVTDPDRLLDDL